MSSKPVAAGSEVRANGATDARLRVAAVQMVSSTSVDENLAHAGARIAEAAAAGAQLVALPEHFALLGRSDRDKVAIREADGMGPIQQFLSAQAAANGVWLIGGTLPLHSPNPGKVLNASFAFAPDGACVARYDKIHLFGFEHGEERFDEAATIVSGRTPVVVDIDVGAAGAGQQWRAGMSVCYDLRFPELYRTLVPADLILVPSAFTYTTGSAHWEVLLRARAIENQCYVLAPAQGGRHENGRRTWGHSMLVDPWGEIVAMHDEGEGIAIGDIERSRLDAVRASIPALRHRVL